MADLEAARRYAKAAFDLAVEAGTVEAWRSDLGDIATVLAESQAAPLLADARLPLERRYAVVDRALDIQPLARNLAKLLIQKGRSQDARAVEQAFARLADEREGIVHAEIVTAVELSPDRLAEIEQRMAATLGKRVRTVSRVDPSILGGLVIRIGDRLVDGSIRTRLRQLRRELQGAG